MLEWERVGRTGVDAGMLMLTDPCYVVRNPGEREYSPFESFDALVSEFERQDAAAGARQSSYQVTNEYGADIGVVVTHFGGDGVFPVYVQRDPATGRVLSAMIRFDGADPNGDEFERAREFDRTHPGYWGESVSGA